jgi:hypothetical protein
VRQCAGPSAPRLGAVSVDALKRLKKCGLVSHPTGRQLARSLGSHQSVTPLRPSNPHVNDEAFYISDAYFIFIESDPLTRILNVSEHLERVGRLYSARTATVT